MAAASQPNSPRASPDSVNAADGAATAAQSTAWPPLEITDYSLDEWLNYNNRPLSELNTTS